MSQTTVPAPMIMYTSRGDWGAFLLYPYLFNTIGDWIGWATPKKEIFNLDGLQVGVISDDNRIIRKRSVETQPPKRPLPPAPPKPRIPAAIPLPPRMAELPFDMIDILEDMPDLLHTWDSGEFRPDVE
jgi:4-fold beta flower protein